MCGKGALTELSIDQTHFSVLGSVPPECSWSQTVSGLRDSESPKQVSISSCRQFELPEEAALGEIQSCSVLYENCIVCTKQIRYSRTVVS